MSPILLLLALLLLCVDGVSATACSINPSSTSTQCYALRASCHWVNNACLQGAPATCEDYNADTTGCTTANTNCAFNTLNGQCYTLPPACATLSTQNCSQRSDCHTQSSFCVSGGTPSTCGNYTTGQTCGASSNCYWDPWTALPDPVTRLSGGGQCFFTLSEVRLRFPCSHWSLYPMGAGGVGMRACSDHSCAPQNSLCVADDAGVVSFDGGFSTSQTVQWAFIFPPLLPDTQRFQAQIIFPLSPFWVPSEPVWYALIFAWVTAVTYQSYLQPGPCSSVGDGNPTTTPPGTAVQYSDLTTLYGDFLTTVSTTHTLDSAFDPNTASGAAILQIVRRWNMTNGWVTQADILNGMTNLALTFGSGRTLTDWAALCPLGVQRLTFPTYTQFNLNISVVAVSNTDRAVIGHQYGTVIINTYGSVTVSATSRAALESSLEFVEDTPNGCPIGQQKRTYTLRLRFFNAFDTSRIVGLRNLSDISMVSVGYEQIVGSPTNAFGTHPIAVIPPFSCANATCDTFVMFENRCNPISADPDSLNKGELQLASARIADMGADLPYPTILDFRENCFIYTQSWPATVGVGVNKFDLAVPAGQDLTGAVPDEVAVTITVTTLPALITNATLGVRAGFLPFLGANLTQALELTNTSDGTAITDPRNLQLYFSRTLVPVVYLPTADERQTFRLTLDLSSLRIDPLSSTGTLLADVFPFPFLTWQHIKQALSAAPRQALLDPFCVDCELLPAAVGPLAIGVDGFAVPSAFIQALMPANGYRLTVNYNITLPANGQQSAGSRRLLAIDDVVVVTTGVMRASWVYVDGSGQLVTNPYARDLGASGESTGIAFAYAGVVFVGAFIVSTGVAAVLP